jgi:t-SNARE syntaxin family protein
MDPFNQVYADAESQLVEIERLLEQYRRDPTNSHLADINNATQELTETIHDLSQSIRAVQSKPSQFGVDDYEINDRISKVGALNNRLSDIQETIPKINRETNPNPATWAAQESETTGGMSRAEAESATANLMYQDVIQEQDTVLDSVYSTVNNLREQANVMSRELEDQSYLIEDFETQVDSAGDRLQRGLKRVDWVLRNNRETLSSCCITLLIVVLIVLLVLLLVL